MLSNHLGTIKLVSNLIVTTSVGKVVSDIISANTQPETTVQQVEVWIGSFAIGGMIAERAWQRTEERIERAVTLIDQWNEARDKPVEATT